MSVSALAQRFKGTFGFSSNLPVSCFARQSLGAWIYRGKCGMPF